jgi:hypothetical protein
MRANEVVIALLETGFSVRCASHDRISAYHADPRVLLTATPLDDRRWRIRTVAGPALGSVDAVLRSAGDVISLLSSVYNITPARTG